MDSNLFLASQPDILLVDDNPQNLRLLRTMLKEHGYKVRATLNGGLALKAVEVVQPDLILLDINLPDMKGYDVCKILKTDSRTADIPVIFISALDEVLDKIAAFEVGGVDYITKPFEVHEVLVRIQNQLTSFMQKKQLIEQQRTLTEQNAQLQLLLATTKAINEASDFSSALEATLGQVCEKIGWDFGEFWIPNDDDATGFEYGQGWYAKNEIFSQFIQNSVNFTLATNIKLLSQICLSKQHYWIPDISLEQSDIFIRSQFVKEVGLKACLAIPILFNDQVLAVLVFFKKEAKELDERLIELVNAIATQLSSLIARKRSESALQTLSQLERERALQLEQALKALQNTQAQLVQQEKMASLGQLMAGVAHEINNPTSFIYGNIYQANEYAEDLLYLLKLYQQNYPNPVVEIREQLEEIEPDFIAEDFPKLITSMKEGANRINGIVLSLKNFSRLDEAQCKEVDIHEGIDNTLLILQHRLKQRPGRCEIQVFKEYAELPLVECYPGQLNQVFMNLLSNAIDAVESLNINLSGYVDSDPSLVSINAGLEAIPPIQESNSTLCMTIEEVEQEPLTFYIKIVTELVENDKIAITISDNGSGILAKDLPKIFDPFFTTKPPGKGTGLGLSISYQIVVERHGGEFNCYSIPSQGTQFVIKLPLIQSQKM
jgi:signal transduction histidine kinase/DNA-binding response OmpR family regulator